MSEETRAVVWISHHAAKCDGCGTDLVRGEFIAMDRAHGIRCLKCAGLDGLVFLPSGDVALTRRARALSSRSAVVLKFSRARRRKERQGVLVEETAIEQAESANARDERRRGAQRDRRRVRDEVAERSYVANFAAKVLDLFPKAPREEAEAIATRACEKYSGRVGRSALAKAWPATQSSSRSAPTSATPTRTTTGCSPRVWSRSTPEPRCGCRSSVCSPAGAE